MTGRVRPLRAGYRGSRTFIQVQSAKAVRTRPRKNRAGRSLTWPPAHGRPHFRGGGMSTRLAWASVRVLIFAAAALIALAWVHVVAQPAPLTSLEPPKLQLDQV